MKSRWSRGLALVGLAAMAALLLRAPATAGGWLGALPLALLLVTGLMPLAWWAVATAIFMLPYFSFGVMELLTSPAERGMAAAFAALAIGVFLAALDSRRRR